ncbi:hypothetical protein ABBQ32_008800 [Trebouxia sp. C0010 RCD-2024]
MSSRDTRSASAPLLLLMKGHPGSGKSTLARLIASNFGITISDKDDSKDCFQAAEKQFGSAGAWDLNALSYQVMFRVASSQLDCGQSVVVDCPLSKLELYQQANGIAEQHHAVVVVIECQPRHLDIWKQRLETRTQECSYSHKPKTWEDLEALISRYNKCDEWSWNGSTSIKFHLLLDTSVGTPEEHLAHVTSFLIKKGLV